MILHNKVENNVLVMVPVRSDTTDHAQYTSKTLDTKIQFGARLGPVARRQWATAGPPSRSDSWEVQSKSGPSVGHLYQSYRVKSAAVWRLQDIQIARLLGLISDRY